MKITIESTELVTDFQGVAVRVWNGLTESGVKCLVFVHVIAAHESENQGEFERDLEAGLPPARAVHLAQII